MIELRPVTRDDTEQIVALETQLFGSDAWSPELVRDELFAEHRHYVVAVDNESHVVGYAGLCASGTEGDVQTIAVVPKLRGQGYGRQLLESLIAEAQRRGVLQLFLEVRADNAPAQRLYGSLGFEVLGERPGYYQPGNISAVVMRKRVSPRHEHS